jgi:hypothetical protein
MIKYESVGGSRHASAFCLSNTPFYPKLIYIFMNAPLFFRHRLQCLKSEDALMFFLFSAMLWVIEKAREPGLTGI